MLKKSIKIFLLSVVVFLMLLSSIQAQKILYKGNIESKIYHAPHCRFYDCKKCTASFDSKQKAEQAGFRPCKVCKP
ncbi:Ada metal-binding domain-containing protein [Desulfovibrio litoralis]|uniref:Metal binding domain of Ada n=1 Tax=Desulfovibrio litoralis DSM 11393 TaxID=1121455 RepID=A0A1M7SSN7_9BACT|nr:Ada metal-binding domain-containing protein [Desulfovibrio litoralis]SHN61396.1 Metal binding domain of Ada [Desulfovibrio litoralis DSM 11393]